MENNKNDPYDFGSKTPPPIRQTPVNERVDEQVKKMESKDKEKMFRTTIDVPDELYQSLKQKALKNRTSVRALVVDAIEKIVSE